MSKVAETEQDGDVKSGKSFWKRLSGKLKKVRSAGPVLRYESAAAVRLKVDLLGPPASGKTQIAKQMTRFLRLIDSSKAIEGPDGPSLPIKGHPAVAPHAEWLLTEDYLIEINRGERLKGERSGNSNLDYRSLMRQLKGRSDRLAVLVINPFRMECFALPALLAKTAQVANAAGDDQLYLAIRYATQMLFEMWPEKVDELIRDHLRAPDRDAADIPKIFAGMTVNDDKTALVGGEDPGWANHLLATVAKKAVDESRPYLFATSQLSVLPNTIVVFTHRDQADSCGVSRDQINEAFQQFDRCTQRAADDRLWLSAMQWVRHDYDRDPDPRFTAGGIAQLVQRIDARVAKSRPRTRLRVANALVGLLGVIGIALVLALTATIPTPEGMPRPAKVDSAQMKASTSASDPKVTTPAGVSSTTKTESAPATESPSASAPKTST